MDERRTLFDIIEDHDLGNDGELEWLYAFIEERGLTAKLHQWARREEAALPKSP